MQCCPRWITAVLHTAVSPVTKATQHYIAYGLAEKHTEPTEWEYGNALRHSESKMSACRANVKCNIALEEINKTISTDTSMQEIPQFPINYTHNCFVCSKCLFVVWLFQAPQTVPFLEVSGEVDVLQLDLLHMKPIYSWFFLMGFGIVIMYSFIFYKHFVTLTTLLLINMLLLKL